MQTDWPCCESCKRELPLGIRCERCDSGALDHTDTFESEWNYVCASCGMYYSYRGSPEERLSQMEPERAAAVRRVRCERVALCEGDDRDAEALAIMYKHEGSDRGFLARAVLALQEKAK